MIVLDEQLLGRQIEQTIERWYRGAVRFIIDLQPQTVIKDAMIPTILRQQRQPTFVTINESDFWRKVAADHRYCVVCFALPDWRTREIPAALRSLCQRPELRAKAQRMGKVIRVTDDSISYYTMHDRTVHIMSH